MSLSPKFRLRFLFGFVFFFVAARSLFVSRGGVFDARVFFFAFGAKNCNAESSLWCPRLYSSAFSLRWGRIADVFFFLAPAIQKKILRVWRCRVSKRLGKRDVIFVANSLNKWRGGGHQRGREGRWEVDVYWPIRAEGQDRTVGITIRMETSFFLFVTLFGHKGEMVWPGLKKKTISWRRSRAFCVQRREEFSSVELRFFRVELHWLLGFHK